MDGCIITAGMSFYGFSRAGNVNVRHVHHDPSQCWLVRRSFASEHYVRGFKPQHNRFSSWNMARKFFVPAEHGEGFNSPRRLVGMYWSA